MECNFCKNKLNSLGNLNYHKKNNKKCLEIQKEFNDNVTSILETCTFCNIEFTNIKTHLLSCKIKKNKDFEKFKQDFENLEKDNQKLKEDLEKLQEKHQKEILEMKEYIIKIQTENNIYKKDHDTITSIAKQPKITTNNNNNTYNLSVYDDDIIKDRFILAINNANPSDLYGGQKSIGRFVAPCLKNDDGTTMISCTDFSRNVFVYKDGDGNINKDIKCKNLANLIEPIATAKVDELIKVDNSKRYRVSKIENLRTNITKRYDEIKRLENHIMGFAKETSSWRHVKEQIQRKEDENERDFCEIEKLQNDEEYVEASYIAIDCDEKLAVAAEDIKEMKTDSCKFSKTISELV